MTLLRLVAFGHQPSVCGVTVTRFMGMALTMELFPFATASLGGLANVVPVEFLYIATDDTLWITDNYFSSKRVANPSSRVMVEV
ncbi:MAG: hypothetical protein ACREV4_01920 [Gammaproteobacteria bacterium]